MFVNLTPTRAEGRNIGDHQDIAWMIGMNVGSGADGASIGRIGDCVCQRITSTAVGGTDTYSKTFGGVDSATRTVLGGFKVQEALTAVAPIGLLLGSWHDGNVALGGFGRIQVHGWDSDATIRTSGVLANDPGSNAIAVTAEPFILSGGVQSPAITGSIATIVELLANLVAINATQQGAVFWRA